MQQVNRAGRRIRRALACVAAGLMFATAVAVSGPAEAARGGGFGGGGFHGGGFHAGGFHGGFHGGGLAIGGGTRGIGVDRGFAGLHNGFSPGQGGRWVHGWHNGRYGWWWGDGLGWSYFADPYEWEYGDYNLPSASPYWYCADPSGYYPYITQCNTAWQTAPGS